MIIADEKKIIQKPEDEKKKRHEIKRHILVLSNPRQKLSLAPQKNTKQKNVDCRKKIYK